MTVCSLRTAVLVVQLFHMTVLDHLWGCVGFGQCNLGSWHLRLMLEVHPGPRQAGTGIKEKPQHCMWPVMMQKG